MRKSLLGVIVGVGMMFAQSANAADMVRYDKSANNIQPEQTVAQLQMDGSCKGPHCQPCVRQCPPRHCHRHHRHHHHQKACHTHKHKHHKHTVKNQKAAHNNAFEEKKMSSNRSHSAAHKTSYQGKNETNIEEYIDDVGRERR